jgi:hypothetical protein
VSKGWATFTDVGNDLSGHPSYQDPSTGGTGGSGGTTPPPPPTAVVTSVFQSVLGRAPTAAELSQWGATLDQGGSVGDIVTILRSSPEYLNRQATGPDQGHVDVSGYKIATVHPADTLQGLAQAAYGDPSLGYVIAKANGIATNADLTRLKTVSIPSQSATKLYKADPQPDPGRLFSGWTRDKIFDYIATNVNGMEWNSSISTDVYIKAFGIYQGLQRGYGEGGFSAGQSFSEVLEKLNNMIYGNRPNPFMYAPQAFSGSQTWDYGAMPQAGIDSLSDEGRARMGLPTDYASIRNSYGGEDQPSAPSSLAGYSDTSSLMQNYSSVPDLTADDLALPKVDVGSLADLPSINGTGIPNNWDGKDQSSSPGNTESYLNSITANNDIGGTIPDDRRVQAWNTGTAAGVTSGAASNVSTSQTFAGKSRDDILSYISVHVPEMTWSSSISTDTYVNAYSIYQELQSGKKLADFPSGDYLQIISTLQELPLRYASAKAVDMQGPSLDYITGTDASGLAWQPPQPVNTQAIQTTMNGGLSSSQLYGGGTDYLGSIGLYSGDIPTNGGSTATSAGGGQGGGTGFANTQSGLGNYSGSDNFSGSGDTPNPTGTTRTELDPLGSGGYTGSLTQGHSSVPDLTADDLALPKVDIGALGELPKPDPSVRLPDGTLVSSLPKSDHVVSSYLTPLNDARFPAPVVLGTGSASLTFDKAGNIYNQTYDANGVPGPVAEPGVGQPKNIGELLDNTFNPQDKLTLLKFAADNIDPLTYAAPAAQLDFDLNPSPQTLARLNEVHNADTLGKLAATLPLAGASAGFGSAFLLPAFGGAGSYLALSGSSMMGDGIFQVGNTVLGNQQGWNPTETALAGGLPVVAKYAAPYVDSLLNGASTEVASSAPKSTVDIPAWTSSSDGAYSPRPGLAAGTDITETGLPRVTANDVLTAPENTALGAKLTELPPPSQLVLDSIKNDPYLQRMVPAIDNVDCSEIAERLLKLNNGQGGILEAVPSQRGTLNVLENGSLVDSQYYHQVYTDGTYVYDPRLSSAPIPISEWEAHMHAINPNGVTITNTPRGLQ